MSVPFAVVSTCRVRSHAPGPFAFKDPAYHRDILESVGFDKVGFDAWSGDLPFAGPGAPSADAVTFALEGMAFRDKVAALDPPARDALARDLVDLYQGHTTGQGVMMPARVWLAQALIKRDDRIAARSADPANAEEPYPTGHPGAL